jgi:hypothetical protein
VTHFLVSSYATRTPSWDRTLTVASEIALNGDTDIVFARGSGKPAAAATITLSRPNATTRTISVTAGGMIDW